MHKKNLIRDDDNKRIYYSPRSEFDDEDDKYKKNQKNNNIDTKPPNTFNFLKSLSQEAEDLMDEIEDAVMISTMVSFYLLVVIKKNNFNTFRMPLNFISGIYNGNISLKEGEFFQRKLEKNRGSKI